MTCGPAALSALLFIVQIARWALKSKARNPFSQTHWASATFSEDGTSSKLAEVHQSRLFDPKEVPSRIDAVVVGSDISCLTTAAILAKTGRTVVVLEGDDKVWSLTYFFQFIFVIGHVKDECLYQ